MIYRICIPGLIAFSALIQPLPPVLTYPINVSRTRSCIMYRSTSKDSPQALFIFGHPDVYLFLLLV